MSALTDYLDEQGFACKICLGVYSSDDKVHYPVQLSCHKHNLCYSCYEKAIKTQQPKNCPECRAPVRYLPDDLKANSQTIQAIDAVKGLLTPKNSTAVSSSSSSALSTPAAISSSSSDRKQEIPEKFECKSVYDKVEEYTSIDDLFENALPQIVDVMQWENVLGELSTEFAKNAGQWRVLLDQRDRSPKGFAQYTQAPSGEFMIQWTAVMEKDPTAFPMLYTAFLLDVKKRATGAPDDWKKIRLTMCFNYDGEEKWFDEVVNMLKNNHIRHEIHYHDRDWGCQVQLTAYPCPKPGHTQTLPQQDIFLRLQSIPPFEKWIARTLDPILDPAQYNLGNVFRWVKHESNPDEAAEKIKTVFLRNPEDFFIYTIDGKAAGFMQFTRKDGFLIVQACALTPSNLKYADHFIQQFLEWATNYPVYAREVPAKGVHFPHKEVLPRELRTAIATKNVYSPSTTLAAASTPPSPQIHQPVDPRLQWCKDSAKMETLAIKLSKECQVLASLLGLDGELGSDWRRDPLSATRHLLKVCAQRNVTDLVLIQHCCLLGQVATACDVLLTATTPIDEIKDLSEHNLAALHHAQKQKNSQPQPTSLDHSDPMQWFIKQLDSKKGSQSPDEKERIRQQKAQIEALATQDQKWGNDEEALEKLTIACAGNWNTIAANIPPPKEQDLAAVVKASFTADMTLGEQSKAFFQELQRRQVTKVELAMALMLAGLWALVEKIQ